MIAATNVVTAASGSHANGLPKCSGPGLNVSSAATSRAISAAVGSGVVHRCAATTHNVVVTIAIANAASVRTVAVKEVPGVWRTVNARLPHTSVASSDP